MSAAASQGVRVRRSGWAPAVVAVVLVVLGVIGTAIRLDAPSDGTVIDVTRSGWRHEGVVVGGPAPSGEAALRAGDLITIVAGHRLTDGLGGVPRPALGATVTFGIVRGADMGSVAVRVDRPNPYPLPT